MTSPLAAPPRRYLWLLVLLALTPCASAKDGPGRLEKAARKQKSKIAQVWITLAESLAKADLKAEAAEAEERARRLDAEYAGLDALSERIAALAGEGAATPATTKQIERAHAHAAKGYDKLARLFQDEKGGVMFARSAVAALALDPTRGRRKRIADRARKGPTLLGSPTHEAVAYVSLPSGWKSGGHYPVLVSVDGAGANFKGNASSFRGARGGRPFITVAPHALSCTNALQPAKYPAYPQALLDTWDRKRVAFDVPGLLALLDFLHAEFGAEERVAITGFSGGGNLCYSFLLTHPERVFCAAPACANFQPSLASNAGKPEQGGPPVHIMTGEKDPHRYLTHGKTPPGIEEQTDWAQKALTENGFAHVTRTMLPGVGHSSLVSEVWKFVDTVRKK